MTPISLILSTPTKEIKCGESHFWGMPHLPYGFEYPVYQDNNGNKRPYCFICQINMADIAAYDIDNLLPHEGSLCFFARIDGYLGYDDDFTIGCAISDRESVRVLYFPSCEKMERRTFSDDDLIILNELSISFSNDVSILSEEHLFLAPPSHRPWETWDFPFEDWLILLQIDSFEGEDFNLNFMDFGVLNFLINPSDLKHRRFSEIRAIILSS